MGQLYIIHANWLYWGAFAILLKPFLSIFTSNIKKILLLHNEKGNTIRILLKNISTDTL